MINNKLWAIILTLSLVVSCSTTPDLEPSDVRSMTYSFPANFGQGLKGITPEQAKAQFHSAAVEWTDACGLALSEVKSGGDISIHIGPMPDKDALGLTYTNIGTNIIFMDSSRVWSIHRFRKVALHEMGHALGLPHILQYYSVMYWKYTPMDKLSVWDKERIQSLYGPPK